MSERRPPFWELEDPKILESSKNGLRWYAQARKLQVVTAPWVTETGEQKYRTVTLSVNFFKRTDELREQLKALLLEIVRDLDESYPVK